MNNYLATRKIILNSIIWMNLMLMGSVCAAETQLSGKDIEINTSMNLEHKVRIEVEEMHQFFVDWFNGTADQLVFDKFTSRFDSKVNYIGPGGSLLDRNALVGFLGGARGISSDFRIAIRDVKIQHLSDSHIIATYTEWQRQAIFSDRPENGRVTTVILSKSEPFRWLHIHETWLPEEIFRKELFDF